MQTKFVVAIKNWAEKGSGIIEFGGHSINLSTSDISFIKLSDTETLSVVDKESGQVELIDLDYVVSSIKYTPDNGRKGLGF